MRLILGSKVRCVKGSLSDHVRWLLDLGASADRAKVPVEHVRDTLGHSSVTMTNAYLRSRGSTKAAYRKRSAHQARLRVKIVR